MNRGNGSRTRRRRARDVEIRREREKSARSKTGGGKCKERQDRKGIFYYIKENAHYIYYVHSWKCEIKYTIEDVHYTVGCVSSVPFVPMTLYSGGRRFSAVVEWRRV